MTNTESITPPQLKAQSTRVLLPIKDSSYADIMLNVLKKSQGAGTCTYMLLSVVPSVFENDVPYSTIEALRRLRERDQQTLQMAQCLEETSLKLQHFFPEVSVSTRVEIGNPCAVIKEQARQWNASIILLVSQRAPSIWHFLRPSLSQQLLKSCDRTINIIRLPASSEAPVNIPDILYAREPVRSDHRG